MKSHNGVVTLKYHHSLSLLWKWFPDASSREGWHAVMLHAPSTLFKKGHISVSSSLCLQETLQDSLSTPLRQGKHCQSMQFTSAFKQQILPGYSVCDESDWSKFAAWQTEKQMSRTQPVTGSLVCGWHCHVFVSVKLKPLHRRNWNVVGTSAEKFSKGFECRMTFCQQQQ